MLSAMGKILDLGLTSRLFAAWTKNKGDTLNWKINPQMKFFIKLD
jgi:hypothetical protein